MKRTTLLFVFLLEIMMATCFAQDGCKLCGDWSGFYTIYIPDSNPNGNVIEQKRKMTIRINSIENELTIRVKTCPSNNPTEIQYWNDCDILKSNESSIKWSSFVRTSYDWNDTDKKNGSVIYKVDYEWICNAEIQNGKLLMTFYLHSSYFDKHGNVIGTHNTPTENIVMYKNDNW